MLSEYVWWALAFSLFVNVMAVRECFRWRREVEWLNSVINKYGMKAACERSGRCGKC